MQHKFLVVFIFVSMAVAGLSGCGTPSTSQEIIVPLTICTPTSPLVNVYKVMPQTWANASFEFAFPPTPIPPASPPPLNDGQILLARYAALLQLTKEVERWSDTKTIKLDDSSKVNITITFISPNLLQAVFLSEILKDRFFTSGFRDQIQGALNDVAQRDELLFLLTVTATNSNVNLTRHTVKIPIQEMFIINSENLKVAHSHDDHNLEQVIDTTTEPVFGYLGYPLSIASADQCKWILDPKYNKNIVITLSYLEVDGTKNDTPYFWTIPYAPLLNPNLPPDLPNFNMPSGFDLNLMTPLSNPPNDISQPNYWQDFGRFIWGQVTLGNY